jgi:hypothetical protein
LQGHCPCTLLTFSIAAQFEKVINRATTGDLLWYNDAWSEFVFAGSPMVNPMGLFLFVPILRTLYIPSHVLHHLEFKLNVIHSG